jgi:hypothetical protein
VGALAEVVRSRKRSCRSSGPIGDGITIPNAARVKITT